MNLGFKLPVLCPDGCERIADAYESPLYDGAIRASVRFQGKRVTGDVSVDQNGAVFDPDPYLTNGGAFTYYQKK